MTGQQDDKRASVTARRRRALRPRHAWRALWGLLSLPVVFVVVAAMGLLGQEITAPTWVKTRVEAQAAAVLGGGALRFGAITVTLAPDLHPVVRLRDARLMDRSGAVIARFPLIESMVSPRGLLLRRAVLPQQVRIDSALFQIRRAADGRFALDLGGDVVAAEWPGVAAALAMFDASFEHPAIAALQEVRATNLRLRFDDGLTGQSHHVDGGLLHVQLAGGVTRITAGMEVMTQGGEGVLRDPVPLRFDYESPRASRAARFDLTLADAPSRDIAALAPAMRWLDLVDADLSLGLRAGLDADGDLLPAEVALSMGAGSFVSQAGEEALRFAGAALDFRFDPDRQVFDFTRLHMDSTWGAVTGQGRAMLDDLAPSGLPGAVISQLRLSGTGLNPNGLFAAPLTLPPTDIDMRLRFDPLRIEVAQAAIAPSADGESGLALASADAVLTETGWQVGIDARMDAISTARLLAYWPAAFHRGARNWYETHVHGGWLSDLTFALRVAPDTPAAFAYSHDYHDATVTMVRGLPDVTAARGHSALQDGAFNVFIAEGRVVTAQGGTVELAGSSFTIPDLRQRPAPAVVQLETVGTITDSLALANAAPFRLLARTPLAEDVATGTAHVLTRLTFPLRGQLGLGDIGYDVQAALRDVASRRLVPGQDLRADALALTVREGRVQVAGDARLGPAAISGTFTAPFRDARPRFEGRATLTPAVLDHFVPALPDGFLTGAALADVTLDFANGMNLSLRSDLGGAGVALPQLGWRKAAGSRGDFQLDIRLGADPAVERLSARFGDLVAEGRIDLAGGRLREMRFSRLAAGGWIDAPVVVSPQDGGMQITTQGGSLDLRGAMAALGTREGAGSGAGGDMRLTLGLDRLMLNNTVSLTGFSGTFAPQAGGMGGNFVASVNGLAAVNGAVMVQGGAPSVRVTGQDAGRVLQAAGVFASAEGGAFDLTVSPAGRAGEYDGHFASTTVKVHDAPALASLLNAVSVVGLIQQMAGQGLVFDEVLADFRISPDRVSVLRASAVGPGLGISLDGVYRLDSGMMDFQGVLSPFYFVNAIGAILTRRGEGLFGFNFTLQGPPSAMQVGVNPLSVLTPGMFREIFRRSPPVVD